MKALGDHFIEMLVLGIMIPVVIYYALGMVVEVIIEMSQYLIAKLQN